MTPIEAIEIIRDSLGEIITPYTDEMEAFGMAIEALMKQKTIDDMVDEIEGTDWYHINSFGHLVHGANSKEDGTEPLYKAEDILRICERYRSEEE